MKKVGWCLAAALSLLLVGSSGPAPTGETPLGRAAQACASVLFTGGSGGHHTYRIPSVVRTQGAHVLAFAEGRVNSDADTGDIDLVMRGSSDGGCTWGPMRTVADFGTDTIGNPATVYDRTTHRVVLLGTANDGAATSDDIRSGRVTGSASRRVHAWSLSPTGQVLTGPTDITTSVKAESWRGYATGPGHGIQLAHGKYAGRLVVPAAHSRAPLRPGDDGIEKRYYGNHLLYSDDHGATWRIGSLDATYDGMVNTNETAVAELPDGTVYLNARDQGGTAAGTRAMAYSLDGGTTLAVPYRAQATPAPTVLCSTLAVGSALLFAGPLGTTEPLARSNLTLRAASRWRTGDFNVTHHLWPGPAAYSDLVALPGDAVGVLYERGVEGPYEQLGWAIVPRAVPPAG